MSSHRFVVAWTAQATPCGTITLMTSSTQKRRGINIQRASGSRRRAACRWRHRDIRGLHRARALLDEMRELATLRRCLDTLEAAVAEADQGSRPGAIFEGSARWAHARLSRTVLLRGDQNRQPSRTNAKADDHLNVHRCCRVWNLSNVHFGRLLAICLHFDAVKVTPAPIRSCANAKLKIAFLDSCNHRLIQLRAPATVQELWPQRVTLWPRLTFCIQR